MTSPVSGPRRVLTLMPRDWKHGEVVGLVVYGGGDRVCLLAQPVPCRDRLALAFRLGAFGAGGGAGCGEVAGLQAAQAELCFDLAALGLGPLSVAVGAGAASVGADDGGHDVDVVVGVAHGDPPACLLVAFGGDACSVNDAAGDLGPLGVGEVAVAGCGADGAVPDVLGWFLAVQLAGAQVDVGVEALGELGVGGCRVAAGVGGAGLVPGGDVRVGVFVAAAGAEEVGDQSAGVGAGGDVRNYARCLPSGAGRSVGSCSRLLARRGPAPPRRARARFLGGWLR
ncbi:hypothetical protein EV284_1903 [Streptomyces sp. BK022]|nr:hypothetical protein EV284_1903 [Streptomyces sp. BK022]